MSECTSVEYVGDHGGELFSNTVLILAIMIFIYSVLYQSGVFSYIRDKLRGEKC